MKDKCLDCGKELVKGQDCFANDNGDVFCSCECFTDYNSVSVSYEWDDEVE